MKLSEAIENFIDAKHEYVDYKDATSGMSIKENTRRRCVVRERYEESKAILDEYMDKHYQPKKKDD